MELTAEHDPWIQDISPEIHPPSLENNTADADRFLRAVGKELGSRNVHMDFSLLHSLPRLLRRYDFDVQATVFAEGDRWHVIRVSPAGDSALYGLALDIGSSTLVLRLVDLSSRETVDEISFINPQSDMGTDILTRIHYAAQDEGLTRLRDLLLKKLNETIEGLLQKHGISAQDVAGVSGAGNTTMTHLFLGLDPYWICREPYIPVVNRMDLLRAQDLGLAVNPLAPVLLSPSVGSYFGGDLIAGILASGMIDQEDPSFLVDVGTNAEVVVGNRDWLMGCAGAAGPALEGGVAGMGMMAGPGVIDKVTIDPDSRDFQIRTIGDDPPVGICGSGLIDLVAQLFLAGMVDIRGKFVPEACGRRLTTVDDIPHLVVVPEESSGTGQDLTLSQPDIDALIRSKAAMYTILTTVSKTVGITFTDLRCFYVAGTFGSYIDPHSAVTIGMIPDLPIETYVPLGNSSLEGATLALLSSRARSSLLAVRDRITYLELNVNQEFMNLFSAAKFIPHTDRSLFPSVKAG